MFANICRHGRQHVPAELRHAFTLCDIPWETFSLLCDVLRGFYPSVWHSERFALRVYKVWHWGCHEQHFVDILLFHSVPPLKYIPNKKRALAANRGAFSEVLTMSRSWIDKCASTRCSFIVLDFITSLQLNYLSGSLNCQTLKQGTEAVKCSRLASSSGIMTRNIIKVTSCCCCLGINITTSAFGWTMQLNYLSGSSNCQTVKQGTEAIKLPPHNRIMTSLGQK